MILFALISLVISKESGEGHQPILTYIAFAIGAISLLAAVVIPHFVGTQPLRSLAKWKEAKPVRSVPPMPPEMGSIGTLLGSYQTRLILRWAILEGAALFNLVAYLLDHQLISALVAAALVVTLLLKFSTPGSVRRWIEDQRTSSSQASDFRK